MKKVLVTSVVTLATALCLSTGHAGNHGKNHGKGKGRSAVISYSIEPGTCAVTINSTKDLSNIVLKDSSGNRLMKWDDLSGKSFSDFGMLYGALLADGSLYVKSGNNGKRGKRNRGLGAEIGDSFRSELADCLDTPVLVQCPAEVKAEIDLVIASTTNLTVFDRTDRCEIYGASNSFAIVYNGSSSANGFNVDFRYQLPDTSTGVIDLTLEEADACQLHTGRCDNYDNLLPQ